MIGLYILSGILLLITIILFMPISVKLHYDDKLSLQIKYLFFKYIAFPEETKIKKPNEKKTKKESLPEKDKKSLKTKIEEQGLATVISDIIDFIKTALNKLGWLLSKSTVKKFDLTIIVASEDAAITAIEYGAVCGLLYPFLSFAETIIKFKSRNVFIGTDFNINKPSASLDLKIIIRPIFAVYAALYIVVQYIFKLRDDNKIKRNRDGVTQ